ncbi:unnamed protein product [Linum trigynum]|uniref:Uncharacterized protein n=1 Tax=Linum trigynum TaxID=586398 RepID=A0AAV2GCD0_9ROSI
MTSSYHALVPHHPAVPLPPHTREYDLLFHGKPEVRVTVTYNVEAVNAWIRQYLLDRAARPEPRDQCTVGLGGRFTPGAAGATSTFNICFGRACLLKQTARMRFLPLSVQQALADLTIVKRSC